MKCTFMTKWYNDEIVCICTLNKKCKDAVKCEELDFKLDPYASLEECMSTRSYKRRNGAIRQVRHE